MVVEELRTASSEEVRADARNFDNDGFIIKNAFSPEYIQELYDYFVHTYRGYFEDKVYDDALLVGHKRTMFTVGIDGPFNRPDFYANQRIMPVITALLGDNIVLGDALAAALCHHCDRAAGAADRGKRHYPHVYRQPARDTRRCRSQAHRRSIHRAGRLHLHGLPLAASRPGQQLRQHPSHSVCHLLPRVVSGLPELLQAQPAPHHDGRICQRSAGPSLPDELADARADLILRIMHPAEGASLFRTLAAGKRDLSPLYSLPARLRPIKLGMRSDSMLYVCDAGWNVSRIPQRRSQVPG